MSGGVKLEGFDLVVKQLANAPAEVRREGRDVVRECTEGAASDLAHHYPKGKTGNLRRGVRTRYPSSEALIGVVENRAPHSHLWHWGTRQRNAANGANRGRMPAASPDPLVPIARKWRERMVTRLMAMLANKGFLVTRE